MLIVNFGEMIPNWTYVFQNGWRLNCHLDFCSIEIEDFSMANVSLPDLLENVQVVPSFPPDRL